jgi:hypothetical protein
VVVPEKFFNFFRNFDPPFPEKMMKARFGRLGDFLQKEEL